MRVLFGQTVLVAAAACGLSAAPVLTISVDPGTSPSFPVGSLLLGFTPDTADPLGPFSSQSVHFQGYPLAGGATNR